MCYTKNETIKSNLGKQGCLYSANDKLPIFLAIDNIDIKQAVELIEVLKNDIFGIKLGKEFLAAYGPEGVKFFKSMAIPIFLDTKYFDIPNTVKSAILAQASLQPFMINVHAMGGRDMLLAAKEAINEANDIYGIKIELIAVTVLTSFTQDNLSQVGVEQNLEQYSLDLAKLAQDCGADGVVSSPWEVSSIKKHCGNDFKTVVPGIRPKGAAKDDQKRIMTPKEALELGADWLVMGRAITKSEKPKDVIAKIKRELK